MASTSFFFLPSEAELYPSMVKQRPVKVRLALELDGCKKVCRGQVVIKGMEPRPTGAVHIKGVLKGKKNGWPDCLHAKIGAAVNLNSSGSFMSVSQNSIYTGDKDCTILLDYAHPEKSWIEVVE